MKISTVLDDIDSGHMVLPKFQRDYVCIRELKPARQVARGFRAILQHAMEAA